MGFLIHIQNRSWGRFWIVFGALVFVRLGAWTHILRTIPDWTTLHPLFLGGIWGIIAKEIFVFHSKPGKDRLLAASVHITFVFFLISLGLERFFEYHKIWEWSGIYLKEQYYYPGLSARQAFQHTCFILDSIIPVVSYFLVEECFRRDTENALVDYKKGLLAAFIVQFLISTIQIYLLPTAFMEATGESLKNGRIAGLLKDSGSASWIYPTIGIYLFYDLFLKKGSIPENKRIFLLFLFIILTIMGGWKLGRLYWFLLIIFILGVLVISSYNLFMKFSYPYRIISLVLTISLSLGLILLVFEYGDRQKNIASLGRISQEWKMYRSGSSFEKIDPRRISLMKLSMEFFLDSPVFGVGLGSTIVELKRPKSTWKNKPADGFVDSPSNFYLGWLGETGILGSLVLISYVALILFIRKVFFPAILLIVPLMGGYQIVHPDGGFFFIFLLIGLTPYQRVQWMYSPATQLRYLWFIVSIGVGLHYIVLGLLKNS